MKNTATTTASQLRAGEVNTQGFSVAGWVCTQCTIKSTGQNLKHHKDEPCPLCYGKLHKLK